MGLREFETDEKPVSIDLLAVNHFPAHRRLLFHGYDLYQFPRSPGAPGVDAKAVHAEVIGVGPFGRLEGVQ